MDNMSQKMKIAARAIGTEIWLHPDEIDVITHASRGLLCGLPCLQLYLSTALKAGRISRRDVIREVLAYLNEPSVKKTPITPVWCIDYHSRVTRTIERARAARKGGLHE